LRKVNDHHGNKLKDRHFVSGGKRVAVGLKGNGKKQGYGRRTISRQANHRRWGREVREEGLIYEIETPGGGSAAKMPAWDEEVVSLHQGKGGEGLTHSSDEKG